MKRPYRASIGMYIGGLELMPVRAAPGQDCSAAACTQCDRLVDRIPGREPEREARGEAVAAAVRVGDRSRDRRRPERAAGSDPAAERAGCRDDDPRLRLELAELEAFG